MVQSYRKYIKKGNVGKEKEMQINEKENVLKLKETYSTVQYSTVQRKKVGTDAQHHIYSTIHTLTLHIWHSSQESTVLFIILY